MEKRPETVPTRIPDPFFLERFVEQKPVNENDIDGDDSGGGGHHPPAQELRGGRVLPQKLPSLRPLPGQPGGRRGGRPAGKTISGPDPALGPFSPSQFLPAPLPLQPGRRVPAGGLVCSESAFPGRRAGPYFIPVAS